METVIMGRKYDAASTTKLDLYESGVTDTDIAEIGKLVNLKELRLNKNQISGLNTLSGLANLTHLYLGVNKISDITPLASLTNLIYLDLGDN